MNQDELAAKIADYHAIRAQMDALERKSKAIKAEIEPVIPRGEKTRVGDFTVQWADPDPRPMFTDKEIEVLFQTWTKSEDPMTRSCGNALGVVRKLTVPNPYLIIRLA